MSLSALNARMTSQRTVPIASAATNTVDVVLDGLFSLLTNAGGAFPTYADGTARTPGTFSFERSPGVFTPEEVIGGQSPALDYGVGSALTGSTWTWTREIAGGKTVAIIGAPPATATAFGRQTRIIIAGNSAGTMPKVAPTPGGSDGSATDRLWIGLVKNVIATVPGSPGVAGSVYNGWSNVAPWVGCQFAGYVQFGPSTTDSSRYSTASLLRVIETQETCWFQITTGPAAEKTFTGYGGGMVDPETGNSVDSEIDGRLYAYGTSGGSQQVLACLGATSSDGYILYDHGGGSGYPHTLSYNPGLATAQTLNRVFNSNASTLNLVTRSGAYPRIGGYNMANLNNWGGRLREVQIVRDGLSQQTFGSGATIHGYTVGYSPTLSGDCLLLQY